MKYDISALENAFSDYPLSTPVAAIDIGGNSFELFILQPGGPLYTVKYALSFGKSIQAKGFIDEASLKTFETALTEVLTSLNHYGVTPDRINAVGTAGLRDAQNGETIAALAQQKGLPLRIISGFEESELIYPAALYGQVLLPEAPVVVLEIGGASTEVVPGRGQHHIESDAVRILPLGSGRFGWNTPRLLQRPDIETLRMQIQPALSEITAMLQAPERSFYLKSAAEFSVLKSFQLISGQAYPKADLLQGLEEITDGRIPKDELPSEKDLPLINKLCIKLLIATELMSVLNGITLTLGPDWGLKYGIMLQLLNRLQAEQQL